MAELMDNSLIKRQDAIDAADKIIERDTSGSNAVVNAMIAWSEYIRSLPPVQPEITQEQLEEYCKKRCLTVITDDLFYELTNGSKNTTTWESCGEFWEHRSGLEKFKCNCCGGEVVLYFGMKYPNFCPYCGRKSIADTGYERKIEDHGYGFMLITKRQLEK